MQPNNLATGFVLLASLAQDRRRGQSPLQAGLERMAGVAGWRMDAAGREREFQAQRADAEANQSLQAQRVAVEQENARLRRADIEMRGDIAEKELTQARELANLRASTALGQAAIYAQRSASKGNTADSRRKLFLQGWEKYRENKVAENQFPGEDDAPAPTDAQLFADYVRQWQDMQFFMWAQENGFQDPFVEHNGELLSDLELRRIFNETAIGQEMQQLPTDLGE